MAKVYVISEDGVLFEKLFEHTRYMDSNNRMELIPVGTVEEVIDRDNIVILDKENYEMDLLRLMVRRLSVLVITEDGELNMEVGAENRVLVTSKPYRISSIILSLRILDRGIETAKIMADAKQSGTDVRKAAETDYLTGLPNRRGLYEYFTLELKSDVVHCMFIDIDNFKKVNDTYGHKMGDKLLIKVSHMMKEKVGDGFFARLSGDEFAIIINGEVSKDVVVKIAQTLLDSVSELQMGVDISSIISFSIGIMFDQKKTDDLDDILLRCDEAMYEAKKNGKGRYIIYNDIEERVFYRMSVNKEKYSALNGSLFKMLMRPCVDMVTSDIKGAEVGIYWDHQKDGLRYPEEYMDILEEDDFIVGLELNMIQELCRVMNRWNGTVLEKMTMSMRLSRKHLYHKDFIEEIRRCTDLYKIKPERIRFVLNEIESHPRVVETIAALKKVGFEIGCKKTVSNSKSSLISVNDHLADEWILDKSMVEGLGLNKTYTILTKSIIALANDLNIQVYAVGVCDKKEENYLAGYGCRMGVGPLYGDVMTPHVFTEYGMTNAKNFRNVYRYDFDGSLKDQNGENEAKFILGVCDFVYDDELRKKVVQFKDGEIALENTLEFPVNILDSVDFSISFTMKANQHKLWSSVLYVDYSSGFVSVMPCSWDGVIMFRTKETIYEDEWNDAIGVKIEENRWYHVTATHNSKKRETRLYVDGEYVASALDVPNLKHPRRVVIGGDLWQGNFNGRVGYLATRDYVMSSEEIKNEYLTICSALKK